MKKIFSLIILLYTQACVQHSCFPNINTLDLTMTGKTPLSLEHTSVEHTSVEERMLDKQLEFERERLLSQEKQTIIATRAPDSQMSGSTKTFLYMVGGAFILGTVGTLRKVTWVSDKAFKAKDYVSDKSKELWNTLLNGRVVTVSKKEFDELKRKSEEAVSRVNDIEADLDEIETEVKYMQTNRAERKREARKKEELTRRKKYNESFIIYNGKGFYDTGRAAFFNAENNNKIKMITNSILVAPIMPLNILLSFFTKKQIKYWYPFREKSVVDTSVVDTTKTSS